MTSLFSRQVLSVNTALVSPLKTEGRVVVSGIAKRSVSSLTQPEQVTITQMGLAGDEQADPTVHGGLSKAVYAYPHEHYAFWQTVRAQAGAQAWGGAPAARHVG